MTGAPCRLGIVDRGERLQGSMVGYALGEPVGRRASSASRPEEIEGSPKTSQGMRS